MKIKEVTIQGMHKVQNTTYTLSDCNYLFGKNGSGKSTVLQAIQLAILGYIPGYPKRNQDIIKHANSKIMSVKVTFENDDYIERTYINTNSKVTCDLDTTIEDIDSITSDIEIPIYNFNSFLSLSPNEQKKWFLGFLPTNYDSEFNWKEMFDKQVNMLPEYNEEYITSVVDEIEERGCNSVEEVCEYIKSIISFAKAQIKSKQSVLSDLMFYEDVSDYDLESVNTELEIKQNQYLSLTNKLSEILNIRQRKSMFDSLTPPTTENFEDEPVVIGIQSKITDIDNELKSTHEEIESKLDEYDEIEQRYKEVEKEFAKCIRPTDIKDTCPYLPDISCKTLITHKKEIANAYKETKAIYDKEKEIYDSILIKERENNDKQNELMVSKAKLMDEYNNLKYERERYDIAKKSYEDYISNLDFEISETDDEDSIRQESTDLRNRISELTDIKSELIANEKYKEVLDSNQKELATWENNLVILEKLKDYTGPNKLQSELAEKPFIDLSEEITTYLKKMFHNDDIECWFNLSSKSNSFDFGIIRDGINIPFTVLSSGEQCMYMLALQSALMISNKQDFNTILIDDAFDHLDNDNIISLVKAVLNTDIQYIIAGVAIIPETKELANLNRINVGG